MSGFCHLNWSLFVGVAVLLIPILGCGQFPGEPILHRSLENPFEALANSKEEADPKLVGRLETARRLEDNGSVARAVRAYSDLTREYPEHPTAYHRQAILHDKTGRCDQSTRFYMAAIALEPESAEVHCDYGYSRYLQGDLAQAERLLREALELNDGLTRAHNNLGLVLARQGKREEALESFQLAGCSPKEADSNLRYASSAVNTSTPEKSRPKAERMPVPKNDETEIVFDR